MLNLAVCVSGGGTNLQAIIDGIAQGSITNTRIKAVISNNPGAYALERARDHGIEAACISPKQFESRGQFNQAFLEKLDSIQPDLVDTEIQGPDYQYPSLPDSLFLRKRVLWAESA